MTNLRFCGLRSYDAGEHRHPQTVMRDLGITYRAAVPQSIADQWWFIDCSGVPEKLPSFLLPDLSDDVLTLPEVKAALR